MSSVSGFARVLSAALLALAAGAAQSDEAAVLVQSTTSTANSGLYDHLLPLFEAESGLRVHVVAVGTGQAIKNAGNCDGDVLLVHATLAEEAFVAEGGGVARTDLMYNDFVLVGPAEDPAGLAGGADAVAALRRIAEVGSGAVFVSRGDDSGTHKKELALWRAAATDPSPASGDWYREIGGGMGATLNVSVAMGAYTLTDRASWIAFENKQTHRVMVEGDDALFNQYGVIPVNPARCPNVNADGAQAFVDWLLSPAGQAAIAAHRVDGQQLFFPNAPDAG